MIRVRNAALDETSNGPSLYATYIEITECGTANGVITGVYTDSPRIITMTNTTGIGEELASKFLWYPPDQSADYRTVAELCAALERNCSRPTEATAELVTTLTVP